LGAAFTLLGGLLGALFGTKSTGATSTVAVVLLISTLAPVVTNSILFGERVYSLAVALAATCAAFGAGLAWGAWMTYVGGLVAWLAVAALRPLWRYQADYLEGGLWGAAAAVGYFVTYLWGPVAMFIAPAAIAPAAGFAGYIRAERGR
jgi:hypothetical protein